MEQTNGKPRRVRRMLRIAAMVLAGIAFAALSALVFGLAVQYLWNWVMPDLFGLKAIIYWQAFALVILAKIFFGRFGRHPNGNGHGFGPGRCMGHGHGISRRERRYFGRYWEEE